MVRHNRVFKCEMDGSDVAVVIPQGDLLSFRYQDVHLESNLVLTFLDQKNITGLVLDLSQVPLLGSVMVGSLLKFARRVTDRKGKAAFCCASPEMLKVLDTMNLRSVWPYYETRKEAINAVRASQN